VPLDPQAETATLAVDSTGRMWVAFDTSSSAQVVHSSPGQDYTVWSAPITLATGLDPDDITAIVAFSGRVGVMWSNQVTRRFGFRTHVDGSAVSTWTVDEVPGAQSAQNVGEGMADDHLHFAVAADGTLYVAVKTNYDTAGFPYVGLLVRRPSGAWDDLHPVDVEEGTRPIVVLNEAARELIVIYTDLTGGGAIAYRVSDMDAPVFGSERVLLQGVDLDDVSSSKQTFHTGLVAIASEPGTLHTAILSPP
jgi:hypothetical protein